MSVSQKHESTGVQNRSPVSYSYRHSYALPGPSPQMYSATPNVRVSFDMNRDPLIARQIADLGKTEAERRRGAMTKEQRRESFMIKRQQPKPVLKPSHTLAMGSGRAVFNAQLSEDDRRARFISQRQSSNTQNRQRNREER